MVKALRVLICVGIVLATVISVKAENDSENTKAENTTEINMMTPRPEFKEPGELVAIEEGTLSSIGNLRGNARQYWMTYCTSMGRIMAVRQARVEAMRRLEEQIAKVFITPETTIGDFVGQSDDSDIDMSIFLQGARETHIRYHDENLIVELGMAVKLRQVYASVRTWAKTYKKGDKANLLKLEKLSITATDEVATATGIAAAPDKHLKDPTHEIKAVIAIARKAPAWASKKLRAKSDSPKDPKDAARRKLAKKIDGLRINPDTTVRDFVDKKDEIEASLLIFLKSGRVVEDLQRNAEDGAGEVTVEVELKPLWNMIIYYQKKYQLIK